jgi:hypothetical protein
MTIKKNDASLKLKPQHFFVLNPHNKNNNQEQTVCSTQA